MGNGSEVKHYRTITLRKMCKAIYVRGWRCGARSGGDLRHWGWLILEQVYKNMASEMSIPRLYRPHDHHRKKMMLHQRWFRVVTTLMSNREMKNSFILDDTNSRMFQVETVPASFTSSGGHWCILYKSMRMRRSYQVVCPRRKNCE